MPNVSPPAPRIMDPKNPAKNELPVGSDTYIATAIVLLSPQTCNCQKYQYAIWDPATSSSAYQSTNIAKRPKLSGNFRHS